MITITGASGFIGTKLIEKFQKKGIAVTNYDKIQPSQSGARTIVADVRDLDTLIAATKNNHTIYNLAAEHADDVSPISLYYDVNVGGAKNIVEAAEINNVGKIVFTSSVAIYGLNVGIPREDNPANPFNDYGQSKLEAEQVFLDWAAKDSYRTLVIIRPVVVFGEGNRGNVYNLINQVARGRFFQIGDGQNIKSMAYVGNVAEFLVHVLSLPSGIHIYNYADKPDMNANQLLDTIYSSLEKKRSGFSIPYTAGLAGGYLFDMLARLTGKNFPISSIRIKKFCANTQVDASKLERTGFVRPYTLKEGLIRMIKNEFVSR